MSRIRASNVLLVLVIVGCAAPPAPAPDPGQVEAVVARFYDGIGAADFPGLDALTTPEFEIVDGGRRMDFSGFQAFLTDALAQGFEIDFALDRFNTVIEGQVAYTTLHAVNQPMEAAFHETVILRRIDGEWLVDRFHSTPVRE